VTSCPLRLTGADPPPIFGGMPPASPAVPRLPARDVVVVGGGVVGLAHAVAARGRGCSVAVVERDERAVGASVRNFGHICTTAQDGDVLGVSRACRERWLALAPEVGFWLAESGTVVVARAPDEMAVLEEFAAVRHGEVALLDRAGVSERANVHGEDVLGGALLPLDLRVDAREAVPALARWLGSADGVDIHWRTNVVGVEPGLVRTSRGDIPAGQVVVAVGHDLDRLMPDVAARAGVERCLLQMLAVAPPAERVLPAAVLTGTSLLRYDGLASCPSAADVRARLAADQPELVEHAVNLMVTQRPNGDVIVGDTHAYATTHPPFRDETVADLLLDHARQLLGVGPLTVRQRWSGVYASAAQPFLVDTPAPGVTAVAVTSGIGMTTAFGLAEQVVDDLDRTPRPPRARRPDGGGTGAVRRGPSPAA
jgi:FAD dependent oxidoreductase TIGR03364